jgi:hypothetical protein
MVRRGALFKPIQKLSVSQFESVILPAKDATEAKATAVCQQKKTEGTINRSLLRASGSIG